MQDKKDFNSTNGSKGKTQELIQKKNTEIHSYHCSSHGMCRGMQSFYEWGNDKVKKKNTLYYL
jgi:hypothetical protein